eukprot:TRINITY_DN562_c0_g1_i1.p1 TRINITY_DN562_c0_g1~~TRINITY_DN562_c0_g1_i1.p1  ORF type:complete len:239 (+),score=43.72 TRINITY_DN562_c0_g1_i1:308-1024(+)
MDALKTSILLCFPQFPSLVVEYLDVVDLCRFSCVCKSFCELGKQDILWERLSSRMEPDLLKIWRYREGPTASHKLVCSRCFVVKKGPTWKLLEEMIDKIQTTTRVYLDQLTKFSNTTESIPGLINSLCQMRLIPINLSQLIPPHALIDEKRFLQFEKEVLFAWETNSQRRVQRLNDIADKDAKKLSQFHIIRRSGLEQVHIVKLLRLFIKPVLLSKQVCGQKRANKPLTSRRVKRRSN